MADVPRNDAFPSSVVPYLHVSGGSAALDFYVSAFGATEVTKLVDENGMVGHAAFTIGEASFNLSDEWAEMGVKSPNTLGGHSVSLCLTVEDADEFVKHLTKFGVRVEREVDDAGPGWRGGWVIDPFGHRWLVTSRKPDNDK